MNKTGNFENESVFFRKEREKMNINIEEVKEIVLEAAKLFQNREAVTHTREKGIADYVTEVDISVQQFICERLADKYPEIQFLGEEKDNSEIDKHGLVWVLDPVDGTTNLIHDYHASVISLGLIDNMDMVMGIVYNPYLKEMFWAEKGKGAYLNGKRIYVSEAVTMEQSLISIGTSPYHKEMAEENFKVFRHIFQDAQDIRRSGSAALDLAYVASGRIEGYFEKSLKIWDYAAGMVLVREAGGKVTDYQGVDSGVDNMADIVAGNKAVADILVKEYL